MKSPRPSRSRGFSIVAAVFLIVVVALIAGYAVTISTVQQADTTSALLAARADAAASSGLEWGIARVTRDSACPSASTSFSPAGTTLSAFSVTVTCSSTAVTEGATAYTLFTLTATATFSSVGTEDYTRRVVTAQVSSR